MDKSEIRRGIREIKGRFGADVLREMSAAPAGELLDYVRRLSCGKPSLTVLLYNSLPDEVYTGDIIGSLRQMGHRVLLPAVKGSELEIREYAEGTATHPGYRGIEEPDGPIFTDFAAIDLAVVPGVAFTRDGCRLGRGKGFYDRFLPRLDCPVVGLAFPFQILESLPCEEHDIKINRVIG